MRFNSCSQSFFQFLDIALRKEAVLQLQLFLPQWFLSLKWDYPSPISPISSFCFRAGPRPSMTCRTPYLAWRPSVLLVSIRRYEGYIMTAPATLWPQLRVNHSNKSSIKRTPFGHHVHLRKLSKFLFRKELKTIVAGSSDRHSQQT